MDMINLSFTRQTWLYLLEAIESRMDELDDYYKTLMACDVTPRDAHTVADRICILDSAYDVIDSVLDLEGV